MKRSEIEYNGCVVVVTSHQGTSHPNPRCRVVQTASIERINTMTHPSWSHGFDDEDIAIAHAKTFIDRTLSRPHSAEYHDMFADA